jgi:hypothetical protein
VGLVLTSLESSCSRLDDDAVAELGVEAECRPEDEAGRGDGDGVRRCVSSDLKTSVSLVLLWSTTLETWICRKLSALTGDSSSHISRNLKVRGEEIQPML